MRISENTRKTIVQTVSEVFGHESEAILFGSRLDPHARGGDIDLLVRSTHRIADKHRKALTLVAKLQRNLGDQPIDVIVLDPDTQPSPIHDNALATGQRL